MLNILPSTPGIALAVPIAISSLGPYVETHIWIQAANDISNHIAFYLPKYHNELVTGIINRSTFLCLTWDMRKFTNTTTL